MGNRAVITTEDRRIGVYLHWNGGRDSVEPMLAFCKAAGYRCPENDDYGWAYLCTVAGCFFGTGTSVGIETLENLDTRGDNGVYIIEGWEIIGRENLYDGFEEQVEYDFGEMLREYNEKMPKHMQLSPETLAEFEENYKRERENNESE